MPYFIYIAIGLFVLAAFMGLIVLIEILCDRPTPKGVVYTHGIFAGIGLLLLILFMVYHQGTNPILSVTILILAALGGVALFTIDIRKKPIPKWLALLHPLIAIIGLITLIAYALF